MKNWVALSAGVQPDNLAEAAAQQAAAALKQKEEALQHSTAMWISRTGAAKPHRALLLGHLCFSHMGCAQRRHSCTKL